MRKYILLRAVKSTTGPYPPTSADPDPRPTKSTSPTVGDGMLPPELDFDRLDVGSPPSKSKKPDPTDPQIFRRYLINPVGFEIFLPRSWLDPARFRQI